MFDKLPHQYPVDPRSSWTIVLVVVQFACLGFLVFTGRLAAASPVLMALEVAALFLGLWAIVVMRPGNVNIAPVVKPGARLVTRGPYRLIRHPMYTSLLLLTTAWLIDVFTWERAVVLVIFLVNMAVKLIVEERYLAESFADYHEYQRSTCRVIPFIF